MTIPYFYKTAVQPGSTEQRTAKIWPTARAALTVRTANSPNTLFWANSPNSSFWAISQNTEQAEHFFKFPNRANSPNTYCPWWTLGPAWLKTFHFAQRNCLGLFTKVLNKLKAFESRPKRQFHVTLMFQLLIKIIQLEIILKSFFSVRIE